MRITRRDFLDGSRVALGGAALGPVANLLGCERGLDVDPSAPYPPARTGMRGSHDGSWERAHALVREGGYAGGVTDTREEYDLVVVGAGLSGLAAAFFFRQARPDARVLVLDNHDDFGGHAKRNEFRVGEELRIAYGGTESIDGPSAYSAVAGGLLEDLGVDVSKFEIAYHHGLYASKGMQEGVFFDRETFGRDQLAVGHESVSWEIFAQRTPLGEQARADLVRLNRADVDYLPELSSAEKRSYLERISYDEFLRVHVGVGPAVRAFYQRLWITYYGLGTDSIPAYWVALDSWLPGLEGTVEVEGAEEEPYIFHFPDGNASIARLLVRSLIPGAVPGRSMEDIVTARVDYQRLDRSLSPVRLRLSSTALRVAQVEKGGAVEVAYALGDSVYSVRAGHCVLACNNRIIPHICPELPAAQKRGLSYAQRVPILYANVLVRNWRPWVERGVHAILAPGAPFSRVALDFPVSLGEYAFAQSPDEPIVLHLGRVPHHPEIRGPDQLRAGRREIFSTSFASYETRIREQLARMLGVGGFDATRDILAITINRWPHGYAYEPNGLWDPPFASEAEQPWVIGRQRRGRIAIANSDAGASAMTDSAIDQAHRAVSELLALSKAASTRVGRLATAAL